MYTYCMFLKAVSACESKIIEIVLFNLEDIQGKMCCHWWVPLGITWCWTTIYGTCYLWNRAYSKLLFDFEVKSEGQLATSKIFCGRNNPKDEKTDLSFKIISKHLCDLLEFIYESKKHVNNKKHLIYNCLNF